LNILLELPPLEVFVKCYKLRATKCTFVEHSSGIISPEIFGKCYKLRASKCTFVEHSSGIISPGSFCKILQTKGYKMYLC
jgi:hypothetical protein